MNCNNNVVGKKWKRKSPRIIDQCGGLTFNNGTHYISLEIDCGIYATSISTIFSIKNYLTKEGINDDQNN